MHTFTCVVVSSLLGPMEFEKIVRDPIHGFVSLTGTEVRIIDSTVFQRLRRIKQLALTNYVFPGAVHTRFEHSIGTLHMASRVLSRLEAGGTALDEAEKCAVRYAALLHDIGHGPFSHVAENFIEFPTERDVQLGHAKASIDIVALHPDFEFLQDVRDEVAKLLSDWIPPRTFLRDIVTGPLDADKMDYLLRDSYFCGVRYGITDIERIVFTLMKIEDLPGSDRSFLGVSWKGREAVESLVLARYFMHNQVYLHHARLICDAMISRAVSLGVKDGGLDPGLFQYKADERYLQEYLGLTDDSLLEMLVTCSSEHSKRITGQLLSRRLFKRVYHEDLSRFPDARVRSRLLELSKVDMLKYEREIAESSELEPEFVILARQSLTKPTYRGTPSKDILDVKTILVMEENGVPKELEQVSPVFSAMGERTPVSISCYAKLEGTSKSEQRTNRTKLTKAAADVVHSIGG